MTVGLRRFALFAAAVVLAVVARAEEPATPPVPPVAAAAAEPAPAPPAPPAAAAPSIPAAPAPAPAATPAAPVLAPEPRIDFELRFPAERGGGKAVGTATAIEYQRDDFATATGNVDIKYQDYDIKADSVSVDLTKKEVTALGHVVIDQGPRRMTGEKATFDLETKTGTLENAKAYLEPDYYFSGSKIKKTGEDTYEVEKGVFTSCKGDSPAWSF